MNCSRCATLNPDNAKFCINCGNALALKCGNCGADNPAGAKFCLNCGQRLAQETAPSSTQPAETPDRIERYMPRELRRKLETARSNHNMAGERRIVTLLFCDVKGSTAMAETLDPEEWAQIMNRIFEAMIAPVYEYEGTIARLMGDSILAFFGAPIAHEDDPQRAILAGLKILDAAQPHKAEVMRAYGLDFDVRVGINTGLVVVGEVGSDLRVEYTAMGDAANLAARMEQTAEPGTVQISEHTYRQVKPLFDVQPLGLIEVKGKREPVAAYRVVRPKAQPGRLRGLEGLQSALVGRDREFDQLRDILESASGGRGHIVSIIGEAGLGKSRLLAELRWHTLEHAALKSDDPAAQVGWYEGRSLSYQISTPCAPFIHLFNGIFGLNPDAGDAANYAQVKASVTRLLPEQVVEIAPFVATMLGLTFGGEDFERVRYLEPAFLRERIFAAVQLVLQRLAQRPLVLVFDDLHWVDPTSLDLLLRLLPLVATLPIAVIALFRPQKQDLSWRFHETGQRDYSHRYRAIELTPLDEDATRTLVSNLLYIEGLPESVRQLILKKAEGNPFFVEEIIRSLMDAQLVVRENGHWRATREIGSIAVPDTLAGVITARLDRLDEDTRATVQTAAVIGREFARDVLSEVYDAPETLLPSLETLQQRELIREKSDLSQPVYLFKHVLTQETAYASLLMSRRRTLHLRVAECLERSAPERAGDIARHFIEAQTPERALPYLLQAAGTAGRAYSTHEAINGFTQAVEILKTKPNPTYTRQAYEGLGGALSQANEFERALDIYSQMLDLARETGDTAMEISAHNKLGFVRAMRLGQFPEAMPNLEAAETLARSHSDMRGLSEICTIRCQLATVVADFDTVIRYMSDSLRLARTVGSQEEMAHGMDHIAATMIYMTEYERALEIAEEGLQVSRAIGNLEHESGLLVAAFAPYYLRQGQIAQALEAALEGTRIANHIGAIFPQIEGAWLAGELYRMRGEYENALAYAQLAAEAGEPLAEAFPFLLVLGLGSLGSIHLEISDVYKYRAAELHTRALSLLSHPGGMPGGGIAWSDIGFCALAVGNIPTAEELFHKGLNMPTIHMNLQRPRFLVGLAQVALARQQVNEAAAFVEQARAFVNERAMKHLIPLVGLTAGRIAEAQGDPARALDEYTHAETAAREMGMRPALWQAQAGMARALRTLGRADEAAAQDAAARAVIAEIAGLFRDRALADAFSDHALKQLKQA